MHQTTDEENSDGKEIPVEEVAHSYHMMHEKLEETINKNEGMIKQISQLTREKELIKQVNKLKSEMEDTQNELE